MLKCLYSQLQYYSCLLLIFIFLIVACKQVDYKEPIISFDKYQIEDGFELQAAASEPFIEAPVAMDFDNEGRMWVVEMKGYMRNLQGTGAEIPNGTITILEDLDHDGKTDHSKIFLDSLVLPRAIAHVYGGLLYAEPPNLWFVDIEEDQPINKVLVDSLYSDGGNVEHQPNGLMMHIDNWIYNAASNARYQRNNGKWIKEPASFRGQWGISKDNFGRLYTNNNATQLVADYVLPNTIIKNQYFKPKAGLNNSLTENQRVFPLHATSVNRGYQKGVLDKDSILINITSACGPLIYRGDVFGEAYVENAFLCAPEANLVKRLKLTFDLDQILAKQAVENREFIASTDEGFRPVNLFNGPDGNLYIVDMHRGIIQDRAFLTPYLQNHMAAKKLDTIIGMGRIIRVFNKNTPFESFKGIDKLSTPELVDLLYHSNGWLRDRAQQLLIFNDQKEAVPLLRTMVLNEKNSLGQIHALHSLNGMNKLNFETVMKVLSSRSTNDVISHALVLAEQFATPNRLDEMIKVIKLLRLKNDAQIDMYIASSAGKWTQINSEKLFPFLVEISVNYNTNALSQEGIMSSLRGLEEDFLLFSKLVNTKDSSTILNKNLELSLNNRKKQLKNSMYTRTTVGTDARTAGYKIFRNLCASCHGVDGDGIAELAPSLKNSKFASGPSERLALIILHGLDGPIHVNGKQDDSYDIMPGFADNPDYTDKDIRDIISYVQNAFYGDGKWIDVDKIKELRLKKPKNGVFSEAELLELEF